MTASVVHEGNIVYLAGWRAVVAGLQPASVPTDERLEAVTRLSSKIERGSIIYAVLRLHDPSNDWLVCDFYLIDGYDVQCVTADVAYAIERHDPKRDVGIKLRRPKGANPLTRLIDGTLSKALFGEPGLISHQLIG
jgi:hypothetical protein